MRICTHEKSEANDVFHSWRNDGRLPSSLYLPNPNGEYRIHPPPLLPVSSDDHLSAPSSSSSSTTSSTPSSFSSSSSQKTNKKSQEETTKRIRKRVNKDK